MALNNLGNVQEDLHHLQDAEASYQEALVHYRRLAQCRPDMYLSEVARTLNSLGNLQEVMNRLENAKASFQEAASLYEGPNKSFGSSQLKERLALYTNYVVLIIAMNRHWPGRTARVLAYC